MVQKTCVVVARVQASNVRDPSNDVLYELSVQPRFLGEPHATCLVNTHMSAPYHDPSSCPSRGPVYINEGNPLSAPIGFPINMSVGIQAPRSESQHPPVTGITH